MKKRVIATGDGSCSIYVEEIDETYHSYHGALQEAKHVFIQNGIANLSDMHEINVLEVGFGTALNAALTLEYAKNKDVKVNYVGLEAFPLSLDMVKDLGYEKYFEVENIDLFIKMHAQDFNILIELTPTFSLTKWNQKIQDVELQDDSFDLIYYDAFGPRAQTEMWTPEIFNKMYHSLKPGGNLVTYCAKGQVKRDLKSVGFKVKNVPGPPGKREMTLAFK